MDGLQAAVHIFGSLFAAFAGATAANAYAVSREKHQRLEKLLLDVTKAAFDHQGISIQKFHARYQHDPEKTNKIYELALESQGRLYYLRMCVSIVLRHEGKNLWKAITELLAVDVDTLMTLDASKFNPFKESMESILAEVHQILKKHEPGADSLEQ